MTAEQLNIVRREQVQRELTSLRSTIDRWLQQRRSADRDQNHEYVGRHETQLRSVESVLCGAADALGRGLCALDPAGPVGEHYEACRDHDEAIVWLRRLWEFIEERFDQRDSPRLGGLVRAADEVVWSCYRPVFVRAQHREPGLKHGPAPLALVEPHYSPGALQADKPLPLNLRLPPDAELAFLDPFVRALPISIVRLPPWCVEAPWWLAYVAHEVGHHVQHDLRLVAYFRQGVEAAAGQSGLSDQDAAEWGGWSEEIFADLFSIVTLGPWALWALVEAEWAPPADMARRRELYPSAAVRLALCAEIARGLGLDGAAALRGLDAAAIADQHVVARRDLSAVAAVASFALGPMRDSLGTLANLCAFDPAVFAWPGGAIARWAAFLREGAVAPPGQRIESGRQIAAGAVAAWSALAALPDVSAREAGRRALAERVTAALTANAPPGTRAAGPDVEQTEAGDRLARVLLARRRDG